MVKDRGSIGNTACMCRKKSNSIWPWERLVDAPHALHIRSNKNQDLHLGAIYLLCAGVSDPLGFDDDDSFDNDDYDNDS